MKTEVTLMSMKRCFSITLFLFSSGILFSQNADTSQCRTFLTDYFDKHNYANYDTMGCHSGGFAVLRLNTPYLNKYMPGYTFFKTDLLSDYENYPKVPAIIVYNEKKPEASYVMYASTFRRPGPRFFKVFSNVQVPDTSERRLLSTDIAGLLVPIHNDAVVKELVCNKYMFTNAFELWTAGSSLRVLNVRYTGDNKIQVIDLINGTAGGDVRNGYIRKE
jgi:hypothetical protein